MWRVNISLWRANIVIQGIMRAKGCLLNFMYVILYWVRVHRCNCTISYALRVTLVLMDPGRWYYSCPIAKVYWECHHLQPEEDSSRAPWESTDSNLQPEVTAEPVSSKNFNLFSRLGIWCAPVCMLRVVCIVCIVGVRFLIFYVLLTLLATLSSAGRVRTGCPNTPTCTLKSPIAVCTNLCLQFLHLSEEDSDCDSNMTWIPKRSLQELL